MEKVSMLALFLGLCVSQLGGSVAQQYNWTPANATFYGGSNATGTMGGACGYGDLYVAGYGKNNTALSTTLFGDAKSCGACYVITCDAARTTAPVCKPGQITVTATNYCPPDYNKPNDDGGWCNSPRQHFDMSQPAWETIAVYKAGFVPVKYARAPCQRSGGIRFFMQGHDYWDLVLISNVGGSGALAAAWVKGSQTNWMAMSRNWGSNWQSNANITGQSLSFLLQTDDGKNLTMYNVAPANWQFNQTYISSINF